MTKVSIHSLTDDCIYFNACDCQGETGDRGLKGIKGLPGNNGANGSKGETGSQGNERIKCYIIYWYILSYTAEQITSDTFCCLQY